MKNLNWKLFENKHNNLSEKPPESKHKKLHVKKITKPGSMKVWVCLAF